MYRSRFFQGRAEDPEHQACVGITTYRPPLTYMAPDYVVVLLSVEETNTCRR